MQYSAILLDTQTLLGDAAEGSSTYAPDQYLEAINWTQEQVTRLLKTNYHEMILPVVAVNDASGCPVVSATIPDDAITLKRAEAPPWPVLAGGNARSAPAYAFNGGRASSNTVVGLDCGGAI